MKGPEQGADKMAENVGSHLDRLTLEHFNQTGQLLPELTDGSDATRDLLEELVDSAGFPPELNTLIRDQMNAR